MTWGLLGPEFEDPVLQGEEAARLPGLWGRGGVSGHGRTGAGAQGTGRGHARPPFSARLGAGHWQARL